ncbi:Cytosol aminopeptidase family catalytic domain protein [Cryptosporidium meleagridis]|uniref:Cytosol aminopeptidase family catalytic domain protein n=1 Tax=Cryptosporidium meleagridis TaxID=93969 RepID=A0A2P4Z331_9CRYT|nr:Cytosol aminopeptidase family catalytic domain protein [Cryptosporidium meleagridis]
MVNPIHPECIPMSEFNESLKFEFSVLKDKYDESLKSDCLVLCVPNKDIMQSIPSLYESLDTVLNGILKDIIETANQESSLKDENSTIHVNLPPKYPFKYLMLISFGENKNTSPVFFNKMITQMNEFQKKNKNIQSFTVVLGFDNVVTSDVMYFCAQFPIDNTIEKRFKGNNLGSEPKKPAKIIERIHFVLRSEDTMKDCNSGVFDAQSVSRGLLFARDLTSAPPNYCDPVNMAKEVINMAKLVGLEGKILQPKECEELKMGAFLAVAQGSKSPAQFVHLTYKPKGEVKKRIALVGKGITMDTGGYNIKHQMIHFMKGDMGGAAAVFGTALSVGLIKPENIEVHFISAICDNLVSRDAYLPGCIITASNGKTIEVGNTDAEGRLTLADALVYACNLKVETVIDLATLTGFNYKLFEGRYASVLGNNDELFQMIQTCGKTVYEKFWQLPLDPEFQEMVKSEIADLNNTSEGKAPVSTSAAFLCEFVDKNVKYAHIDIAGCSGMGTFGNGFGVKTLVAIIKELSSKC